LEVYEKIHHTKKLYANRTFSFLEGKLESIVSSVYLAMVHDTKAVQFSCPTETPNCLFPKAELDQQLMIYRLMLRDIFLLAIKNRMKNSILENGYHDYNKEQIKQYCERNGKAIHDWITLEVGLRGINSIPELLPFLGEGNHYSQQNAIDSFTEVINEDFFNEELCEAEIKKIKQVNWKFWEKKK
jgi:hypothetical protein